MASSKRAHRRRVVQMKKAQRRRAERTVRNMKRMGLIFAEAKANLDSFRDLGRRMAEGVERTALKIMNEWPKWRSFNWTPGGLAPTPGIPASPPPP
jgi:ABC-type antimicrobial peptide transport system ATPase subunit